MAERSRMRYEVAERRYGRKLITGGINNPLAGLLDFPRSIWTRITPRPLGLARAKALADASATHATVVVWGTADKVYDNGKRPLVPEGWYPAD